MHASRICEVLRSHAHGKHAKHAIALCRIAWALDQDRSPRGQRALSRAAGVSLKVVKQLLPAEGDTDRYGLIYCIAQGNASIHPDEVQASRYMISKYPGTKGPTACDPTSTSSATWREVEGLIRRRGSFPSGVAERLDAWTVQHALDPSQDVWRQAGPWAWAFAVLTGWTEVDVTMPELRAWTGMTDRGVRMMVAKWEEAGLCLRLDEPGKATVVRVFGESETGLARYGWTDHAQSLQWQHIQEGRRHRARMTDEGLAAWQIAQGSASPKTHGVPAEVAAQGEDVVYRHLTGDLYVEREKGYTMREIVEELTRLQEGVPTLAETGAAIQEREEREAVERAQREAQRAAEEARERAEAREYLEALEARRRADDDAYWAARKAEALELARRPKEPERDPQAEFMARFRQRLAA